MRRRVKSWIERRSPAQVISGYYLLAVLLSIVLLSLPAALKPGVRVTFFETVFTAVSVVSDTGLGVFDVSETYSVFGYFLIMLVLQFGGIGIMAMSTFFWLLTGRRIGLRERRLIMVDNNQFSIAGLVGMVREILRLVLLAELVGAIVLGLRFLRYYPSWKEAFLHGLFASVSATTNAGMDITGQSLTPYAGDYFVQAVTVALIIFGAIGFPVLIEAKDYLAHRKNKILSPFHFSLFAKIATLTYGLLLAIGTLLIWAMEWNHAFRGMSWHESFFYAFFQAATTRSAGLTTIDINRFAMATLLLMSIFMFIGGSPNSVGGGIRTTTLAFNLLFIFSYARGDSRIKAFRRELHPDDIQKSFAITFLAIFLCGASVLAISLTDAKYSLTAIFFEVCSAFGTVGLSTGITPDLSPFAQCLLMALMFVGRIGLSSVFLVARNGGGDPQIRYPKERVITG